eukprot:6260126-Prymnesium_polylepis.1
MCDAVARDGMQLLGGPAPDLQVAAANLVGEALELLAKHGVLDKVGIAVASTEVLRLVQLATCARHIDPAASDARTASHQFTTQRFAASRPSTVLGSRRRRRWRTRLGRRGTLGRRRRKLGLALARDGRWCGQCRQR